MPKSKKLKPKKQPKPPKKPLTPKEFEELQQRWYAKLAKGGFKDIEDSKVDRLRAWHSFDFPRISNMNIQQYFLDANAFLNNHSFETNKDRVVWQLHAEGLFLREIAAVIGCGKDLVSKMLKRLQKEFYVKHPYYTKS